MRQLTLVNKTLRPETEMRPRRSQISPKLRRWENASQDHLGTEELRPRLHPWLQHIMVSFEDLIQPDVPLLKVDWMTSCRDIKMETQKIFQDGDQPPV